MDAFISYSRRDLEFVQALADALQQNQKTVWFDQIKEPLQGIAPGSHWWEEIQYGVQTADNFLLLISPNSIASPYCNAEIAHALSNEKRIVTVLYTAGKSVRDTLESINTAIDDIDPNDMLPDSVSADVQNLRQLTRRNWLLISGVQFIAIPSVEALSYLITQVIDAIDLDIEWLRMWNDFRQAVQLWAENDKHDDFRWGHTRLEAIRKQVAVRKQALDEIQAEFLEPEQVRLYRELEKLETSHERRRDIGDRLAVIGDTREGVGVKDGVPDMVWLPVSPTMSSVKFVVQDTIMGPFEIAPFFIAKYLLTHSQYQAFIDADDGFDDVRWWEGFPEEYRAKKRAAQRSKMYSAPRDSISWYESVAFARWLNHQKRDYSVEHPGGKILIVGETAEIRLPTEWEWQWAAQGELEEREYPWGVWEPGFANTHDAGLTRTTVVGMYPHGAAKCGALDMAGNLSEWCQNNAQQYRLLNGYNDEERKIRRGGSFYNNRHEAATSFRNNPKPSSRYSNYGLRLVLALPLTTLTQEGST